MEPEDSASDQVDETDQASAEDDEIGADFVAEAAMLQ